MIKKLIIVAIVVVIAITITYSAIIINESNDLVYSRSKIQSIHIKSDDHNPTFVYTNEFDVQSAEGISTVLSCVKKYILLITIQEVLSCQMIT